MSKCKNCDSENWAIASRVGALETWRCVSCGREETMHVYDPASEPLLPPSLEPVFQIIGRWVAKPSPQQISEIQGTFPALRNTPASVLLRKALEKSHIELGRFTESEIQNLDPVLHRIGMEIKKTPISVRGRE